MTLCEDETLTDINDGLRLIQKKDGLTFGSDAYLLAAYVRRQSRARAVDLGSGTGVIPLLLLSREKAASVDAVEVQPDFAALIDRNAELNGFTDRLRAVEADVRELTPDRLGGTADIVVSNPPYMKVCGKSNESERKNIARHELCGGIGDFCGAAYRLLKHGGLFYVVWRPDRLCDLMDSLRAARLEPKRMTFVHARADLPPCLVLCEAKKGASAGMYVTPPLILYETGTVYTAALTKIYETGEFDEPYQRP
ncbi:MAG: methyltransferase [Clostridia bacterium]|nr:methyltransferase [Clostridia bacterium]